MIRLYRSADRYFFAFVLANMAQGASSLLIPLFVAAELGGDVGDVGLVTGLASLAAVPAGVLWGRLSDRSGHRKPFVLIGLFGVALALAGMGLARSVGHMVLLNALLNVTWLASAAVATLIALEGTDRGRWESRIGRFNRFNGLGWVSGLLLGAAWMQGVTEPLGSGAMRGLFFVLGGLALGGAGMALAWMPEPRVEIERLRERRFEGLPLAVGSLWERFKFAPLRLYHMLTDPALLREALLGRNGFGRRLTLYLYGVALWFTGFSAFFVVLPLFLKDVLGLSPALVFALFVVHSGSAAWINPVAGRLLERWGTRRLQLAFLAVRVAVFLLAGLLVLLRGQLVALPAAVAVLFVLTGISWAFVNVAAMALISRMAPEGRRGQALGVYHALLGAGRIAGALIGGQVAARSYLADFGLAAGFVLLGLGLAWRAALPRPRPRGGPRAILKAPPVAPR